MFFYLVTGRVQLDPVSGGTLAICIILFLLFFAVYFIDWVEMRLPINVNENLTILGTTYEAARYINIYKYL